MTNKLQILGAQIQTDIGNVIEVLGRKIFDPRAVLEEMERINNKIRAWSEEADRIMDEARAIDSMAEAGKVQLTI